MQSETDNPHASREFKRQTPTEAIPDDSELRSELYFESRESPAMTTSQLLDSIEEQIREIEDKLIKNSQLRVTLQPSTSQYAELEDERRRLKKDLIDLDYQHKLYCERLRAEAQSKSLSKQQNQRKQSSPEASESHQQYESRYVDTSRNVDESLEQMKRASRERAEEYQKIFGDVPVQKGQMGKQENTTVQKSEQQLEEELILAQQRSRIAEIQLQIASESLRRSREVQMEAELQALRIMTPFAAPSYGLSASLLLYPYSSIYRPYLGLYSELPFI